MICRCGFISCYKCPILVGDADNEEGYVCVGVEDTWRVSVPSFQFFYEAKTAQKLSIKNYLLKK